MSLYTILLQQYVLNKAIKLERVIKFSSAEAKLLILIGYYFVVHFVFLIIFSALLRDYVSSISDMFMYLRCELFGHDPSDPCDDSTLHKFRSVGVSLGVLTLLLNGLSPLVHLVYVINAQELKEKFGGCIESLRGLSSSSKTE